MYCLLDKNIKLKGEIRIPEEKKIIKLELDDKNIEILLNIIENIKKIISIDTIIEYKKNRYCKLCSYSEFCRA